MKPVLLELVHLRTYPISKQGEWNICSLIKPCRQPLAPTDIKQQFWGGGLLSESSWLTISNRSSSCNK